MEVTTYSDARANLKALMDRVVADRSPVTVTRQRGAPVVMLSLDDWNSIEETLYLLSSPKNAERLLKSIAELEAGNGEEHDLIEP